MAVVQRSGAIDAVRVVGVIGVVAGHVWTTPLTAHLFYPWHVPLFFFLTGYFWSRGRTFSDELKRRSTTLALPYVTWLLSIGAMFVWFLVENDALEWRWLSGPLYGGNHANRPFTTLWFVSVLFFAALLYRVVSRLPMPAQWVVAAVGLGVGYRLGDHLAATPLAIGSAIPCLIFLVAGASARSLPTMRRPLLVGLALIGAGALSVGSGLSDPVYIKGGSYGTPVLSITVAVAISFGLVLVSESVFAKLPQRASTIATQFAAAGFTVVLSHCVVLWFMDTPATGSWRAFVLALVIPWVIGLIALRTPISVWLTGVRRPQKNSAAEVSGSPEETRAQVAEYT